MRFTVRVAEHEEADPAWRIGHAGETFSLIAAYFETDDAGQVIRADDGTFAVHAPSWTTLDTLYQMFDHEGLTLVGQEEVPGHGIHPKDEERLRRPLTDYI